MRSVPAPLRADHSGSKVGHNEEVRLRGAANHGFEKLTGSCAVQSQLHLSCTAGAASTKIKVVEEGKIVVKEGANGVRRLMPRAMEASFLESNAATVLRFRLRGSVPLHIDSVIKGTVHAHHTLNVICSELIADI